MVTSQREKVTEREREIQKVVAANVQKHLRLGFGNIARGIEVGGESFS